MVMTLQVHTSRTLIILHIELNIFWVVPAAYFKAVRILALNNVNLYDTLSEQSIHSTLQ